MMTTHRFRIYDRPDESLDLDASAPQFAAELQRLLPAATVTLEGTGADSAVIIDGWTEDMQPGLEGMYDTEDWMVIDES